MNLELYRSALEQRLSSRLRVLLALFVNLVCGFGFTGMFPFGFIGPAATAYIIAAGILGREFSAGTPQLTFARPVSRAAFVLSRWLACVTLVLAFNVISIALALVVAHAAHTAPPDAARVLVAEVTAFGTCAVVVGFSALTSGMADVVFLGASAHVLGALTAGVDQVHDPDLGHFLSVVLETASRCVLVDPLRSTLLRGSVTLASAALFGAVTVGWLLVAVWAVGRREITYATD
jgi:hypothetical protein